MLCFAVPDRQGRSVTGKNNGDGTVDLYAVTSTVSTSGDQGADPNLLVTVTRHPTPALAPDFLAISSDSAYRGAKIANLAGILDLMGGTRGTGKLEISKICAVSRSPGIVGVDELGPSDSAGLQAQSLG